MDDILNKDLYEILRIKKDSTLEEIRFAYRRLARIYHPDINEDPKSIEIFKQIRYAYDILSDEKKKSLYDIKNGFNQKRNPEPAINPASYANYKTEPPKQKQTEQKSNKTNSKTFGDIFNGIFVKKTHPSNKNKSKKQNGEDLFANVTISSKEALLGTSRIINVVQSKLCPNCEGKKFINEALCPLCKGQGEISNHKKINAKIPPNTKNGEKIKLEGLGNQGLNGGKPGDLYLIVTIDEKSLFNVKDDIVYMDLPITPYEAALGANIEIPTLYENVTIKIPPNTSSGQRFRLKAQGVYIKDKNCYGDMIVTAIIKLPQKLSEKEIELYKSLSENSSIDIREGLKDE